MHTEELREVSNVLFEFCSQFWYPFHESRKELKHPRHLHILAQIKLTISDNCIEFCAVSPEAMQTGVTDNDVAEIFL